MNDEARAALKWYEKAVELQGQLNKYERLAALEPYSIDAMLDDPDVAAALGREYARQRNGEADYDNRPSYKSHCDGNAVAEIESALVTVREAISDACEKAKQEEEISHEQ